MLECFFVIGTSPGNVCSATSELRLCWPSILVGSKLEQAVVRDGFCPGPSLFFSTESDGFGGQPFVFTLLETALDEMGDPSGILHGCVYGASVAGEPVVLCIMSKLPLFDFHFKLLNVLSNSLDYAEEVLAHVHSAGCGQGLLTEGIGLAAFPGLVNGLKLVLPCPPVSK